MQLFFESESRVGGPSKVIINLKKGLKLIGEEFESNPSQIEASKRVLFTQSHPLLNVSDLTNVIIGPNICVLPIDSDVIMQQKYNKIITPSNWVANLYSKWINKNKIIVWPVGIDTNMFKDVSSNQKEYDCLIYKKNRSDEDLNFVINTLMEFEQSFNIIEYGKYNEQMFLDSISKSKYSILLANTESQGIAMEEIMSSNLPMFVWDMNYWDHRGEQYKVPASSVPYWDDICGKKITKKQDFKDSFSDFLSRQNSYNPRSYIIKNLTLEQKAKELLTFYDNI
tara:strand:+ start:917 stop:1762 length:846 start_codon:yes stop_codon:yes gene_type:complete